MKRVRTIGIVLITAIVMIAASACSSGPKLDGKTFYKINDDGEGGYYVYTSIGWDIVSENSAIWMDDSVGFDYEIDGNSVLFSSNLFSYTYEYIEDYDIPSDAVLHKSGDSSMIFPVPDKAEVLKDGSNLFLYLDPAAAD